MIVRCDQELFEMFPEASVHAIVFHSVAEFDPAVVAPWKQKAMESVGSSGFTSETVLEAPAVKEWRNAFQRFGVKPSKFRSSIEQLFRRALKQEIIETSLPLVNLYCYVSLIEMVPMGAYDVEKVDGDIVVRLPRREWLFIRTMVESFAGPGTIAMRHELLCLPQLIRRSSLRILLRRKASLAPPRQSRCWLKPCQ